MHRRSFILRLGLLTAAGLQGGTTLAQTNCVPPPGATGIDVIAEIKALRIPTGPYAGGYEIAPNGRLNWYFTQLGLLPIVQYLSPADLDNHIRTYLDLYLRCLTRAATIDDINFPFGRVNPSAFTKVESDSDDAYAATFMSLAVRYVRASRNWAWWEANKARIKEVAYLNLAVTAKPGGLTSVFQAPRSQTNNIGYLMDNCENYRGLRDLASLLLERGERTEAAYYDLVAANIAGGIATQIWNVPGNAFTASDAHPVPDASFYPGTTCQIYAQAFGLVELTPYFNAGWAYLNSKSPGWEDGHYDPYPWAILGTVAAMRGERTQAAAQVASIERKFATNRPLVTINELGFYQRTRSILAGGVPV